MWLYEQAKAFLERFVDNERRSLDPETAKAAFSLDEFERFLISIGDPHRATRFIHIAGTKGKGSTALFLASILRCAGYRIGVYTSPHIRSFCERISVNGAPISEAEFAGLIERLAHALAAFVPRPGRIFPTVFELLTAAAFLCFAQRGVEAAVIETGLGGRLDSTNVVLPVVSILTALGRDHLSVLGTALQSIAREKAGIIKDQIPVVLGPQTGQSEAEAVPVVEEVARGRGARLIRASDRVSLRHHAISEDGQKVIFSRTGGSDIALETAALNVAQVDNLATVVAAVALLREGGFRLPDDVVQKGVKECVLPGRTELVCRRPVVIVDGAHCSLSARTLSSTLRLLYPGRPRVYLLGILLDKQIDEVIDELVERGTACCALDAPVRFIVFRSPSPRACPPEVLAERLEARRVAVSVADSPEGALEQALVEDPVRGDEIIVATGSIYNIAPIVEAMSRQSRNSEDDVT